MSELAPHPPRRGEPPSPLGEGWDPNYLKLPQELISTHPPFSPCPLPWGEGGAMPAFLSAGVRQVSGHVLNGTELIGSNFDTWVFPFRGSQIGFPRYNDGVKSRR